VGSQIVHDDDVTWAQQRREMLLDPGTENMPFIGPSTTNGATMASQRKPATKVVVFQ
jgi:hypothetical protein